VLQCAAVCCSVLTSSIQTNYASSIFNIKVAVYCSVLLQCVAVYCSELQSVAGNWSRSCDLKIDRIFLDKSRGFSWEDSRGSPCVSLRWQSEQLLRSKKCLQNPPPHPEYFFLGYIPRFFGGVWIWGGGFFVLQCVAVCWFFFWTCPEGGRVRHVR